MTTIAWDGTILAADSRATAGSTIIGDSETKIIVNENNADWTICGVKVIAFASAGSGSTPEELQNYLIDGITRNTEMREGLGFTSIIICFGHGFEIYKSEGVKTIEIQPLRSKRAIGSGGDFALAAMLSGKDACDAVSIAKQCDVYTGGPVVHVRP